MTHALDKLEVSIRQGPSQPAGGVEGNYGVLGVGEHQNRRPDRLASQWYVGLVSGSWPLAPPGRTEPADRDTRPPQ